ncbi:unnamed protein product [Leptosia nina]|uniref:DUF4789 domain-containing protein n=1 Tax=Leptosia nina TaxID=320188 RepID=A0AAV1JRY2_9NEOP
MFCYYTLFVGLIIIAKSEITKDTIGFPESEENLNLVNKKERYPVYLPSMCGENELYYPGDQEDDWICDCRPGYLYYPEKDSCWPAFRRGPCNDKEHLRLPHNSIIPVCVKNPCNDGFVVWKGTCQRLGSTAPCKIEFPPAVLWVNATTMSLGCVPLNFHIRSEIAYENAKCPLGCKRHVQGLCVPETMPQVTKV